ncbi:RNA-binding protein, putative [Plasmodium berghei]|uniref:RNA-binding protein, putative n=1 Tax=Plasmodium berghei TaxID=5821 RepID=A0A0Y9ZBV6_PLABE|nr:RNA-binding protein, putative [Plasmodium berghei]
MDSLYGDLPPPVSTQNNNVKNNDNKNSPSEVKNNNYIELNKYLITPSIIQKKIANIKNVSKELEIGKTDENSTKNSNIDNNGENSDVKKNEDSKKIEIININQSIQDDLKKISGMLKKMNHGTQDEHALVGKRSYQEKHSNHDLYGDIKSNKLYENFKNNNLNRDFKNSDEHFTDGLYDKYFIVNANEDYDPRKPNDLNKIIKERKRKKIILLAAHKKKMEEEKENERHQMQNNGFPFIQDEQKPINNINDKNDRKIKIKPLIGENSISQKLAGSNGVNDNKMDDQKNIYNNLYENNMPNTIESKHITGQNSNENANEQVPVKKDFATRMMEKMGWKKGEGLGKDKQGIKAPLILQKVDKRSGVIVQAPIILKKTELANENNNYPYDDKTDAANSINNVFTRIIQLTNLVTIDEVDDTLKEEIEEEASKFGNLLNISIITDSNLYDALAVKIFCEYESKDQANNAFNTFKERTFAGRKVIVSFVNEQEYLSQGQNK